MSESDILFDVLDIDQFNADFEKGMYNHLHNKKKSAKKKEAPKWITLKDYLPTEIIAFLEKVTCKGCGNENTFLKNWGLKTYYPKSSKITAVSEMNVKYYDELKVAGKFGKPYVTEVSYAECGSCQNLEGML